MAEARVTQAGQLVEIGGSAVAVTQAGLLVEVGLDELRLTQAALLVEISQDAVQVTLAGVLIEVEYAPPPARQTAGGEQAARAGIQRQAAAAAAARSVSAGAASLGNQVFATLAASLAAVAPQTVMRPALMGASGGGGGGASGMSEVRTVAAQVLVCWDGATWSDESDHFVSGRGGQALIAPEQLLAGGRGQVGSCQITLANDDDRYSARNATSPLYGYLVNGAAYLAKVLVNVLIDGVTHRVFTGVLREISEAGATAKSAASVQLDCRSREEPLLQDKRSTTLGAFLLASATARTEDYHLVELLTLAGLVDGVDFVSGAWAAAHPGTRPTIDSGIFPIRYVWLDDESVLDEVWSLAAACCGWFYCDVDGALHYHNITGVTPAGLQRQYGAVTTLELDEGQVAGLRLAWPTSELYGEVTVEVSPRSPGPLEEVWTPDEVVVVQPGQVRTIWARLPAALAGQPELTWQAFTAGGMAITSGVTVTPAFYSQRVKLQIANSGTRAAYLRVLKLTGQVLVGGRSVEVTATSEQAFWASRPLRRRSLRGNLYVQQESQAETLAAYLLARAELPTLTAQVPNLDRPDVRLCRPVEIAYAGAVPLAGKIVGVVSGLSWSVDRSGYHCDATILETGSLFGGRDPFFVLGMHRLGDGGAAGEAFLFY